MAKAKAPASAAALSLLLLADDLQERILSHLEQKELLRSVPLVCKRLDALQKGSRWAGATDMAAVPSLHTASLWPQCLPKPLTCTPPRLIQGAVAQVPPVPGQQ